VVKFAILSEDGGIHSSFACALFPAVASGAERGNSDKPFVPAAPEYVNAMAVIFG